MRIASSKVVYPELSYAIYGMCYEVQNKLGRLLNEKQYCDALEVLLRESKITFVREYPIELEFRNRKLGGTHRADFFIDGKMIIEVKTKHYLTREDYHQLKRYLQATGCKLGLLINFREQRIRPQRVLNSST